MGKRRKKAAPRPVRETCAIAACHRWGTHEYEYPYPMPGVEPGPRLWCEEHLDLVKTLAAKSAETRRLAPPGIFPESERG